MDPKFKEAIKQITEEEIDDFDLSKTEIVHIANLSNNVTGLLEQTKILYIDLIKLYDNKLLNVHPEYVSFMRSWIENYDGIRSHADRYNGKLTIH